MSEVNQAICTLIPKMAVIEDNAGMLYIALTHFVWEVQVAKVYEDQPHLHPKAFFTSDYDDDELQEGLFAELVKMNLLMAVEANWTAITHINRQTNHAQTQLYPISSELRGPQG